MWNCIYGTHCDGTIKRSRERALPFLETLPTSEVSCTEIWFLPTNKRRQIVKLNSFRCGNVCHISFQCKNKRKKKHISVSVKPNLALILVSYRIK